jgi:hypothetical protein
MGRFFHRTVMTLALSIAACHRGNGNAYPEPLAIADGTYEFVLGPDTRGGTYEGSHGVFVIRSDGVFLLGSRCPDHSGGRGSVVTFYCGAYEYSISRTNPIHGSSWKGPGVEMRTRTVCARTATRADGSSYCAERKTERYAVTTQVHGSLRVTVVP